MTNKEKVTLTLDHEELDEARRAVEEKRAKSVSAYVNDVLRQNRRDRELDDLFAQFEAPTAEDEAWVHDVLYGQPTSESAA